VPDAFVGSDDGDLYAINGADGKLLWKYLTTAASTSLHGAPRGRGCAAVGSLDKTLLPAAEDW